LPGAAIQWLALHLGWVIVLGCGARLLAGRFLPRYPWALALLVFLLALLPGAVSPAFWLGLAFQSPSLMTVVIGLAWLLQQFSRASTGAASCFEADVRSIKMLSAFGVVLGWVLLLDTLAWFSVSVYAWGFSSPVVIAAVVVAALFWVQQGSVASALPLAVLTLFVLTRLPSGNLWDALLDPWLWLVLQTGWLFSVLRRRLTAATRA
jgi:hypothetical protein